MTLLILGAGYLGGALAERALTAGYSVTVADNWRATKREQWDDLAARGVQVRTADIRRRADLDELLAPRPARVYLLAAQANRQLADRDPDYTEETNVTGVRRVAEAVVAAGGAPVVFASSLYVYGPAPRGEVTAEHPYGAQNDLAHLSKVYGELCLSMHARRAGFDLSLLRLAIVYGPSPIEHDRPEALIVVDKFRRLAAAGQPLALDDGGRATVGVMHVEDATRILLDAPVGPGVRAANAVAETVTVADVAALVEGRAPAGRPACTYATPFTYEHQLAAYLRS